MMKIKIYNREKEKYEFIKSVDHVYCGKTLIIINGKTDLELSTKTYKFISAWCD